MAEVFWSWSRSPMFQLGTPVVTAGRLQAGLPLQLRDIANPAHATPVAGTPFELIGPGDIATLEQSAIITRVPPPGAPDAVQTMAAHIEFSEPDLLWRYTPAARPSVPAPNDGLKPWMVLVVCEPQELILGRRGTVLLMQTALGQHNLDESHRWAHVHDTGARSVGRLLCPRQLQPQQDYFAVLVPAFSVVGQGDAAVLGPAWNAASPSVTLPCFDVWRFHTGGDGDFPRIAGRLRPIAAPADFGVARAWFGSGDPPAGAQRDAIGGALTRAVIGQPPLDSAPVDPVIEARIRVLTGLSAPDGRWLLSLPDYGGPWPVATPPPAAGWRDQLTSDPRRRGAAGLGAWAGIEWQRRIADAAAAQAGALSVAAQRIRYLTLGLAATRGLWSRRLPPDSAPIARLAVLAPALARVPAGPSDTVLGYLAGRTPSLGAELFSTAARRVLRPGPARTTLAAPGATNPAAVLAAAGNCPPPAPPDALTGDVQKLGQLGGGHWEGAFQALVDAARHRAGEQVDALINPWRHNLPPGSGPSAELIAALEAVTNDPQTLVALRQAVDGASPSGADFQTLNGLLRVPPAQDNCQPVDMAEVGKRVGAAFDPTVDRPLIVDRVLATIKGLREPVLAPPDIAPELDLPLWQFLAERAPDWLLPGVGDLQSDKVVAVASNPVFVDAFLVGANVQTLGELRWRNIPITTGWTPLRRFWLRVDHAANGPATDIRPIIGNVPPGWTPASALGDDDHAPPGQVRTNLVIVFRTELFRRYPATLVYLAAAGKDAGGNIDWKTVPNVDANPRVWPVLTGTIGPDVVFFGFPVPPDAGTDHWIVLEEPPHGVRFLTEAPADPAAWNAKRAAARNGAEFANATFARQVRVFLGKLLQP